MLEKLYKATMILLSLALVTLCVVFLIQPESAFAASITIVGDNLGISIVEDSPLFTVENMAPGDKERSLLTIRNDGNAEFLFTIQSNMESGDESLFENLVVSVENDSGTVIYFNGPISEMDVARIGPIPPGGEKQMGLSVYFPSELGNEYQNLSLSIEFIFIAYADGNVVDIENEEIPGSTAVLTPIPVTTPTTIYIPNDEIPAMGEKSLEILWIAFLSFTIVILKSVHVMINRNRRVRDVNPDR